MGHGAWESSCVLFFACELFCSVPCHVDVLSLFSVGMRMPARGSASSRVPAARLAASFCSAAAESREAIEPRCAEYQLTRHGPRTRFGSVPASASAPSAPSASRAGRGVAAAAGRAQGHPLTMACNRSGRKQVSTFSRPSRAHLLPHTTHCCCSAQRRGRPDRHLSRARPRPCCRCCSRKAAFLFSSRPSCFSLGHHHHRHAHSLHAPSPPATTRAQVGALV